MNVRQFESLSTRLERGTGRWARPPRGLKSGGRSLCLLAGLWVFRPASAQEKPPPIWVVALDWWGMGADTSYFPGARSDGRVGSGGVYWILKQPPPGTGRVYRVRTEIAPNADVVVELQSAAAPEERDP